MRFIQNYVERNITLKIQSLQFHNTTTVYDLLRFCRTFTFLSLYKYVSYISDPPPSYESLFGKIKRAKAESSGRVDFAKRSCSICTESGISRQRSKDINTIIGEQHCTLLYQYIKIYKDNITIIGRQHWV